MLCWSNQIDQKNLVPINFLTILDSSTRTNTSKENVNANMCAGE